MIFTFYSSIPINIHQYPWKIPLIIIFIKCHDQYSHDLMSTGYPMNIPLEGYGNLQFRPIHHQNRTTATSLVRAIGVPGDAGDDLRSCKAIGGIFRRRSQEILGDHLGFH